MPSGCCYWRLPPCPPCPSRPLLQTAPSAVPTAACSRPLRLRLVTCRGIWSQMITSVHNWSLTDDESGMRLVVLRSHARLVALQVQVGRGRVALASAARRGGSPGPVLAPDLHPGAKVARWQNLIPSFPWIAPGWRAWGCNPRKGRDQILQRSVAEP